LSLTEVIRLKRIPDLRHPAQTVQTDAPLQVEGINGD
jgi:hypothetical protein